MFEEIFNSRSVDERGVSPVIGVILMVAITVILAAVIASFVLGFGDTVSDNVRAGADIEATQADSNGEIRVTWISEGNADRLNVSVPDDATDYLEDTNTTKPIDDVGGTVTFTEDESGEHDVRVTVIAEADGQQTVISTETVTI